jgi:2-dehydro-3-deoxyphosphogluconate aldolase/(4S)-4-hydroxy-2-oxoglutarate aldolase
MSLQATFDSLFRHSRIMVILRNCFTDEGVRLAIDAWDAGVKLVEVPLGTGHQLETLRAVAAEGSARNKIVGAGTVLSPTDVNAALDAGARYTVAPGFDSDVLTASLSAGLPHLPGVATPTEIQQAQRAGCEWVKVFPASILGPRWVAAIRGPFPGVQQVVTGGITIEAAPEYLAKGARMVAFGAHAIDRRADLARLARDTCTRL